MAKKPRFKIGDWVKAQAIVKAVYASGADKNVYRVVYSTEIPTIGQIIGYGYRHSGEYKLDEECLPQLINRGVHKVWRIATSYTGKPVEAFDEDVSMITTEDVFMPNTSYKISEQDRQWLSKESKKWPRDKKGRFCK